MRGRLHLPHGAVRVRIDGPDDAPALLLSHSLAAHSAMWDAQAPVWARRFRVVRYDLPGHGGSAPPLGPLSVADLGRQALALMDALSIARADWCGLSLGGMIGLWLMANAPERIGRAVLAHTAAHLGPRAIWEGRIVSAARGGLEPLVEPTLALWFSEPFRHRAPNAVERARAMIRATSPAGFQGACAAIRDMDLRDSLGAIPHPALVIVGRHDRGTPPEHGLAITRSLRTAETLTLDTGHFGNIEDPAGFTEAVERFLAR
jgi:3-oxoadipate enol-lactonase